MTHGKLEYQIPVYDHRQMIQTICLTRVSAQWGHELIRLRRRNVRYGRCGHDDGLRWVWPGMRLVECHDGKMAFMARDHHACYDLRWRASSYKFTQWGEEVAWHMWGHACSGQTGTGCGTMLACGGPYHPNSMPSSKSREQSRTRAPCMWPTSTDYPTPMQPHPFHLPLFHPKLESFGNGQVGIMGRWG